MPFYREHDDFSGVKESYTYDDLLLVPQLSNIYKRGDVDLRQNILGMNIDIPIIPANMSTICGNKMVSAICKMGGTATIHRFLSPEEYLKEFKLLHPNCTGRVGVSLGLDQEWNSKLIKLILKESNFEPSYAIIDIAHGHHSRVIDTVKALRKEFPVFFDIENGCKIIAGNICTGDAVKFYDIERRVDKMSTVHGLKVGIGGGSICKTRQVSGCGFPQLSAVKEVAFYAKQYGLVVISDGGIRDSGDITKAIAAGADLVMAGGVFAGTDETPGEIIQSWDDVRPPTKIIRKKRYNGMASESEHKKYFGKNFRAPEGTEQLTDAIGPVEDVVKRLCWGLKSGLSYMGCRNLEELREVGDNPKSWTKVTHAGLIEGTAHFRK